MDNVELARIRISGLLQLLYWTVKGIQADDINPHDEDDIAIIEIFEDELESVYRLLLEEKKERERCNKGRLNVMSAIRNQNLKWALDHNFEIEDKILNSEIRGVYGLFVGYECVYVGRSYSIYARLFKGPNCHIKRIIAGEHVTKVLVAVNAGGKATIRVLQEVVKQNDHPAKDAQRLASAECYWIDYYQALDQCLEQYPEGKWN